jgi:hypothetical protein
MDKRMVEHLAFDGVFGVIKDYPGSSIIALHKSERKRNLSAGNWKKIRW